MLQTLSLASIEALAAGSAGWLACLPEARQGHGAALWRRAPPPAGMASGLFLFNGSKCEGDSMNNIAAFFVSLAEGWRGGWRQARATSLRGTPASAGQSREAGRGGSRRGLHGRMRGGRLIAEMPVIRDIVSGSIADEGGARPGERLVAIGGEPVRDVFDYRFLAAAAELEIELEGLDGQAWYLDVSKDEDEDLGFVFDGDLLDRPRACRNKCVFCFIDQLPRHMRGALYFKDDDLRLSFLNGNYVTLTNARRGELDRVVRYRMSPVNISVHATDAGLRAAMLGLAPGAGRGGAGAAWLGAGHSSSEGDSADGAGRGGGGCCGADGEGAGPSTGPGADPRAGEPAASESERAEIAAAAADIMPAMRYLTERRIDVNAQIVLCRGINDGAELDRTLTDLAALNGHMKSISVVPAGMTKFRDGLPPMRAFGAAGSRDVLAQIGRRQAGFLKERRSRLVYPADEFFAMASEKIPGIGYYEDFPQLENGVGMLSLFKSEFDREVASLRRKLGASARGGRPVPPGSALSGRRVSSFVFTGVAAHPLISRCAGILSELAPSASIAALPVRNGFFGETITVAGLLTGSDILAAARGMCFPAGARAFVPRAMLKHGTELLLDDISLEMLRNELKVDIMAVDGNGRDFARSVLWLQ
jgi:NifB/MoaA-like Fe-S oxidoreductase